MLSVSSTKSRIKGNQIKFAHNSYVIEIGVSNKRTMAI